MNIDDEFKTEEDEYSQNRFTFDEDINSHAEKIYIPRRRHNFMRISIYVIGSLVLIFILSFLFAAVVSKKDKPNKPNEKHPNLLHSLFMVVDKSIWAFDVEHENFTVLKTAENDILTLGIYLDKTVYWTENGSHVINSFESNYPNVTSRRKWQPQSIAFDYITEKLYLIDKSSGSLNVIDKDGKYYAMLISDLKNPHDLALDPAEGLVFIVEYDQTILRSNMDGTSVTKIIDSPGISAITLDSKAMKIYWANDKKNIEISDYDGNKRLKIIDTSDMGVQSLAFFQNRLYWTSSSSLKSARPYSSVLWSCSLNAKSCDNATFFKLPFQNVSLVRASFGNQLQQKLKNPCEKNNNGCQHLCLMTSRGNHDCVCNIGWRLNTDGKTCSNNISVIVYIQDNLVKGKMLHENKDLSIDTVIPTKIYMVNLKKKAVIYFDYDIVSGRFYFSDDHSLYVVNLIEGGEQKRILNVTQNFVIGRITLDWMADKIYFVLQSQSTATNHSIEEFSLKNENGLHKSVVSFKSAKDSLIINCPLSLVVHPMKKYLLYILYDSRTDYIQRVMINDSNMKPAVLQNSSVTYFELITLSVHKSEIYFIKHNDLQTINIIDFNGIARQNVTVKKVINSVKFAGCNDNSCFMGNFTGIWQINRETGQSEKEIATSENEDGGRIHSMKIYNYLDRLGLS